MSEPAPALNTPDSNKILTWILLGLILVVAAGLRFYGLEKESLWADELESWRISSLATSGEVIEACKVDVHPPGYQLFLWVWIKVAGDSPTGLRLPSAFFGLLAVGLMFLLGKRWFSDHEGLLAAGLMAVFWFPVYYSQESRVYAFLLVLALLSFYAWSLLIKGFQDRQKIPWFWGIVFVVTGAVGAYSHYFMLTLLLVQAVMTGVMLLGKWKPLLVMVGMYLGMGVLFIPWLPAFFEDLGKESFWIQEPGWDFYFEFFRRAFFFNFWISLGLIGGMLSSLFWLLRKKEASRQWIVVLVVWALGPFLIAFLKSKTGTPVLTYQNLILTLPALYLWIARGIVGISFPKKLNLWAGGLLVGFALIYLLFVKDYYQATEKMQYREAAELVISSTREPQNTLVLTSDYFPDYFGYYLRESDLSPTPAGNTLADWSDLQATIQTHGGQEFWYLAGKLKPEPELIESLKTEHKLIEKKEFFEVDVWRFENRQKK